MTMLRECFVLPAIFLTVALLGGFRAAAAVRMIPPSLMSLVLGLLLMGCLARTHVFVPDHLMNSGRSAAANLSGLVVLLTLFAACAQVFNLVLGDPTVFIAGDFLVRSKPPPEPVARVP